jgi:hypothetical protein
VSTTSQSAALVSRRHGRSWLLQQYLRLRQQQLGEQVGRPFFRAGASSLLVASSLSLSSSSSSDDEVDVQCLGGTTSSSLLRARAIAGNAPTILPLTGCALSAAAGSNISALTISTDCESLHSFDSQVDVKSASPLASKAAEKMAVVEVAAPPAPTSNVDEVQPAAAAVVVPAKPAAAAVVIIKTALQIEKERAGATAATAVAAATTLTPTDVGSTTCAAAESSLEKMKMFALEQQRKKKEQYLLRSGEARCRCIELAKALVDVHAVLLHSPVAHSPSTGTIPVMANSSSSPPSCQRRTTMPTPSPPTRKAPPPPTPSSPPQSSDELCKDSSSSPHVSPAAVTPVRLDLDDFTDTTSVTAAAVATEQSLLLSHSASPALASSSKRAQVSELGHDTLVSLVYQLQSQVSSQEKEVEDKSTRAATVQKQMDGLRQYIVNVSGSAVPPPQAAT